ncbi:MAG: hypothetical protein KDD55_03850 [Bdellovibrionales bacterium]|nr:hypothetical protein [Bdellovibrionales bacterium]
MKHDKIAKFMTLAGQGTAASFNPRTENERKLGAQLLLSEVLEYVIKGLGVQPIVNGEPITDPNGLTYEVAKELDHTEMLDGLADVAYTMYWNSCCFGLRLEEAFELVCDNNLEKFVVLLKWNEGARPLEREEWHCGKDVSWPPEVVAVEVVQVGEEFYAVGKDKSGKVRKPSTYESVDLSPLVK